jgi:hypothetical protein
VNAIQSATVARLQLRSGSTPRKNDLSGAGTHGDGGGYGDPYGGEQSFQ